MMPSSRQILEGLTAIANDWQALAIVWHTLLGALLLALVLGWRPSKRLAGVLLAVPLASVSVLAWISGNPFNGILFAAASLALTALALRLPGEPVQFGPTVLVVTGVLLFAFGWVYPHFLKTDAWVRYLYAAPTGLVPCPTLSVVVGLALIVNGLESRAWALVVSATGVLYGVIGAFRLGVTIDLVLLVGAIALAVVSTVIPRTENVSTPAQLAHR
jgi:hypothetical protein